MLTALDINFWSALLAGLVAAHVMMFADFYLKGALGLFGMLPTSWAMRLHTYLDSVVFTMVYGAWVYALLPGADWYRGLLWGIIWWLFTTVMFAILGALGAEMFRGMKPTARMLIGRLLTHALWGLVIGLVYRP